MNSKYVMLEREKMQNSLIKTIEKHSQGEIIEKKSRFIANIYPINSKKEAETLILEIKNKYRDAKHNCFAFSVYEENQKYAKCSDDGEPSGTAGVPILNVIEKNNMSNILIVITRYFGGILLGTGGLTRAYSEAATEAINNSKILYLQPGREIKIEIDYQNSENFKFYCKQNKITIKKINYHENVSCIVEISDEQFEKMFIRKESNRDVNTLNVKSYDVICRKYVKKEE